MCRLREPTVRVAGTRIAWTGLDGWIEAALRIGAIVRFSRQHYRRCDLLYRSLTIEHIRASQDADALTQAAQLFADGRHGWAPSGYSFDHVFSRAELGERIVEAHNQHRRVLAGIGDRRRIKGPRFDPRCLPDDRLAALIQSHPDLEVVKTLRTERARRVAIAHTPGRELIWPSR